MSSHANSEFSLEDRKKYERKKRGAEKRRISFDISIEEFIKLNEMLPKGLVKCFYTGVSFVQRKDHPNSATLERLCDRMPYRIDNVVWVTKKSNEIKDAVFDKKSTSPSSLSDKDLGVSRLIKNSFNDVTKREEVRDFYINYCHKGERFEKFEITHKLSDLTESLSQKITEETHEPPFVCNDIEVSTLYQEFYKVHKAMDFDLSFSDFKSLITNPVCDLTGERIFSINDAIVFIKSDENPITISNCVTTTKETYFACLALIEKIGVDKSIKAITSIHRIFKKEFCGAVVEEIGTPLSKAIKDFYENNSIKMFSEGDEVFINSPKKKSHGIVCRFNKYTLSGGSLTASLTRVSDGATINSSVKDILYFSKILYEEMNSSSKIMDNDDVTKKTA